MDIMPWVRDLQHKLQLAEKTIKFWENQYLQMQTKCSDLETRAASMSKYNLQLLQKLESNNSAEILKKKQEFEAEIQKKKQEFEAMEGKYKELIAASKISADKEIQEFVVKCSQLESGKKKLDDEIEVLKTKCSSLFAKFKEKEAESVGFAKEMKTKEVERDGIAKEMEKLMVQKLELEDKLENHDSEMQEKIASLEKDLNVEREMLDQLKTEHSAMKCEQDKLKGDIEALKKKLLESNCISDQRLDICVKVGKDLEVYKSNCDSLSADLKEKEMKVNTLTSAKVALENELWEYKTASTAMSDRERAAQEKIAFLEGVVKKTESDKRELDQLKTENRDLKCGKQKAEEDIEIWKRRFIDMEKLACVLEETCRKMDGEGNAANVDHLKGNMLTKNIRSSALPPIQSSLNINVGEVHVSGRSFVNNQSEPSEAINDKQKNVRSDSKLDSVNAVRRKPSYETEGSSRENLGLMKQGTITTSSTSIIEIDDSEDEKEITCKEKDQVLTVETLKSSSGNGKNLRANKGLKRPLSTKKVEGCEIKRPKRCKISEGAISESKSQDEDTIPIGKILNLRSEDTKVERLETSSRRSSWMKPCQEKKKMPYQKAANPTFANGQENVVEGFGPNKVGECSGGMKPSDSADSGDSFSDSEDSGDSGPPFHDYHAQLAEKFLKKNQQGVHSIPITEDLPYTIPSGL